MKDIEASLHFLKMGELRACAERLSLPTQGVKKSLIVRIIHFLKTGEVVIEPPIPPKSRGKKSEKCPLHPHGLILYGQYTNDLATREFFKKLIGDHFHFTARGIDWIKEKWLSGEPPTYQEFATFWQGDLKKQSLPKKEWAYINFTQEYLKNNPHASRSELLAVWKKEQKDHKNKVEDFIEAFLSG